MDYETISLSAALSLLLAASQLTHNTAFFVCFSLFYYNLQIMATKSIEMGETKKTEPKKKEASGGHGDAYSGAISSRAIEKKKARQVDFDTKRGIGVDKRTGCQKKTDSTGLDWGKSYCEHLFWRKSFVLPSDGANCGAPNIQSLVVLSVFIFIL